MSRPRRGGKRLARRLGTAGRWTAGLCTACLCAVWLLTAVRPLAAQDAAAPSAEQVVGRRPPLSTEEASRELSAGTIQVRVVDAEGKPGARLPVRIGILGSMGERRSLEGETNADGKALFQNLEAGDKQAYRVSVPFDGARYGSAPFRLPLDHGYDVMLRVLPTTRDDGSLLLYLGQLSVELNDERLKIYQQVQLANLADRTYVMPEGGLSIALPRGFTAFQTQESMSDLRVIEESGRGVRVVGSLPPGHVTLSWGFHLPVNGSVMDVSVENPWKTFEYRVFTDAGPGLTAQVAGFPEPQLWEDRGRKYWVTQQRRAPGDPPLKQVSVTLAGIPGPGPGRWIATGLALFAVALGLGLAWRRGGAGAQLGVEARAARKEALLEQAASLSQSEATGELGPEYTARELERITAELANLLRQESLARTEGSAGMH